MNHNNIGYLRFREKKIKRFFDGIMYFVIAFGVAMNLPQIIEIYTNKNAAGVSSVSWLGFTCVSIIWFSYGMVHKDKAIMLNSSLLIVMQSVVAIGSIIY